MEKDIIYTNNINRYAYCRKCNCKLIIPLERGRWICSSAFVEEFPGWCYECLLTHCLNTECEVCEIKDKKECSFKGIKEFYQDPREW